MIVAMWAAYCVVTVLRYPVDSPSWRETATVIVIGGVLWALLTPWVLYASHRLPVRRPHAIRNVLLLVIVAFVVSAVHPFAYMLLAEPTLLPHWLSSLSSVAVLAYDDMFLVSFLVIGAQYWMLSSENAERLRAEAGLAAKIAEARLTQLRSDLNPHFLFNTLNSIAALLNDRPAEARSVLRVLSELLQRSNDWGTKREIPLREEVGFLERYLDLQRVRFRDRLSVSIDVPAELDSCLVPPLILQPLVENAVIHGVAPYPRPGTIRIEAARNGEWLMISIRDTGGAAARKSKSGVGLANVEGRLRWMYGARQRLTLETKVTGSIATIAIPLSMEPAA